MFTKTETKELTATSITINLKTGEQCVVFNPGNVVIRTKIGDLPIEEREVLITDTIRALKVAGCDGVDDIVVAASDYDKFCTDLVKPIVEEVEIEDK